VREIHNFRSPQFDPRRPSPCTSSTRHKPCTGAMPSPTSHVSHLPPRPHLSDSATRGARDCLLLKTGPPCPGMRPLCCAPRLPLTQLSWEIISGHATVQSDRCLDAPYRPNQVQSRPSCLGDGSSNYMPPYCHTNCCEDDA
jgi:hypothetical protein